MESTNPNYQVYNQSNQGDNNGGFNNLSDKDKLFMLISIGSWLLILITGWICFAVPDLGNSEIDVLITWHYIIYETNEYMLPLPLLIYYVLFYMVLIVTLLCLTAAFITYIYGICIKKEANIFNGMLGNLSRFHCIPLACVSALFIIGETFGNNIELKGGRLFFNVFFTIIGLVSLIFIYIQTKIESPSYALWSIKHGAYGSLIALLMHNIGYGITLYGAYLIDKKHKNPEKWLKGCYIAFSIIIGLGNLCASLILKEIVTGVINLLIYIGMTVHFFKLEKDYRKEFTVAPGVIDIFMIFFSMLIVAYLFMKEKSINFNL